MFNISHIIKPLTLSYFPLKNHLTNSLYHFNIFLLLLKQPSNKIEVLTFFKYVTNEPKHNLSLPTKP